MNAQFYIIGLVGFVVVLLVFAVAMQAIFGKAHPEHVQMSPAEEAKYELHPTVTPSTLEITAENVHDIINLTIEDGVAHPALALRKAQA